MSKRSIILLLFSALLIYLVYIMFFQGIVLNNNTREIKVITKSNSDEARVEIKAFNKQEGISSLELEIHKQTAENVVVELRTNEDQIIQAIQLKKGKNEHVLSFDWYSKSCKIKVYPLKDPSDELTIAYRFIGSKFY